MTLLLLFRPAPSSGGRYRLRENYPVPQPVQPILQHIVAPATFKKVKHYPIIEIDPYVSPNLVKTISVKHIFKPIHKSTKLQDILDDDEEVLMLL